MFVRVVEYNVRVIMFNYYAFYLVFCCNTNIVIKVEFE